MDREADRTEMGQETVWQKCCCLNMAPADLQPGNWGCPPSFLYYYSLYLSSHISSPCLFPSGFSCLPHSALFICSIFSPLNYSPFLYSSVFLFPPLLSSLNKHTAAGHCSSRGSSAMCSWSKFHIEAPWVASHATLQPRVLHLACNETSWWSGWGAWIYCWLTIPS